MDELDAKLRKAMQALERTVPASFFDELPSRIEARLEVEAMAGTETDHDHDRANSNGGGRAPQVPPREETSGLHDIKALARSQKQRISKRTTTQSDAEASLLTSTAGLRAVALPEPSKEVATGHLLDAPPAAADRAATASAGRTSTGTRPAAVSASADTVEPRGGLPVWIYAAVGAVAVAAVVFFVVRGGGDKQPRSAAAADRNAVAAGSAVATGPGAGEPAAAHAAAPEAAKAPADEGAAGLAAASPGLATPPTETEEAAAATTATTATGTGSAAKGDGRTGGDAKASGDADGVDRSKTDGATKGAAGGAGAGSAPGGASTGSGAPGAGSGSAAGSAEGAGAGDKVKAGGGGTSLEDLLNEASGGAANPTEDTSDKGDKKPTKTKLDTGDIRSGMSSVNAQGCFEKYGVPGNVQIKFTVEPSGKVTKAAATGSFKGTETGNCVAGKVSAVSFPAFDGAPMSFTYPFLLAE